jgi:hypothetical protein
MKDTSKPVPEREMRTRVIKMAKLLGCVPEVETIFKKYDSLLRNCVDPTERYQIGLAGVSELHTLMGMRGALIVNGQIIIPQAENFDPAKYRISG